MGNARDQPAERCEFFRLDQRVLGLAQILQRGLGRIPCLAHLALAGLERGFGALALGNLLGGNIDADDLAIRIAVRMPVGDPKALTGLVGALAGHLDAGDGIAGPHDRGHDALDRVGQRRHAIAHIAPQMILDRNAADIGQALVDLEVAAVRRQESKPDRRGVVDQLQCRLLRIEHGFRKRRRQPGRDRRLVRAHRLLSVRIANTPN